MPALLQAGLDRWLRIGFLGFTAEGAENAEQEKREKEMGLKSRVC